MAFYDLNRRYRHIQRYRQIAEVFIRNGFGYLLDKLDLYHLIPLKNRVQKWKGAETPGQGKRLRRTLEQLGPTFIKLGQVLSMRSDLFPREIRMELEKLQDEVQPVEFSAIQRVIRIESDRDLSEIFAEFDETPLAAASIGQVHRARLKSGEIVVVKVQRPGIERKIRVDLEIMRNLAMMIKDRMNQEFFDPVEIIQEFNRAFRAELDYLNEARNAERFYRNMEKIPGVVVPKVYWSYTTQRMLVMEYVEGCKVAEVPPEERPQLAKTVARSFLNQILHDGFFHGDPHPGNLFIGKDQEIIYLDFGLMGEIDERSRDQFARLFLAVLRKDTSGVVDAFTKLGVMRTSMQETEPFKREIGVLIEKYYNVKLKEIKIGDLFDEIMEIARKYGVHFPSDFILLGKAIITLEGVVRTLDPALNILEMAKPFALKLIQQRLNPRRVLNNLVKGSNSFFNQARALPEDLHRIFEKILDDNLEIKFKHQNLENVTSKMDIVVNRLVVGLIVSALFVGSSLTIQAEIGPQFQGVSTIGFAGYLMAGILGVWLVIAILRSGRF